MRPAFGSVIATGDAPVAITEPNAGRISAPGCLSQVHSEYQ